LPKSFSTLLLRLGAALGPGASYEAGALRVAALSLAGTAFFLFVGQITFPGGAFQFTDYTSALLGTLDGGRRFGLVTRDIGYPLLLIGTGYPLHHSFIGVLLLQALMAWLMPLLVYGTIGSRHRVAAYAAAVGTVLSMAPYLFMKWIHHDQTYIFLSLVTIYLAVEYLREFKLRFLYLATLAVIATSLTRPAGNLLVLPLLAIFWYFKPAHLRHLLVCGALIVLAAGAYAAHRKQLFADYPAGYAPSYTGRQIFYNLYVNSADFGIRLDDSMGPATATLLRKAREHVAGGTLETDLMKAWYVGHGIPEEAKRFWFTQYNGAPAKFMESLVIHPSHDYFEFFCAIETNDRVFRESAIEIARAHPVYVLRFALRNLGLFFWSPGYMHGRKGLDYNTFNKEHLYFLPLAADLASSQIEAYVPAPGKFELQKADPRWIERIRNKAKKAANAWRGLYERANQVTFALGVAALAGLIIGPAALRPAIAVIWLFFLYNAAVTCAFAEPNYRYHFFGLATQLMLAGMGLAVLWAALSRARLRMPRLDAALARTGRLGEALSTNGPAAPSLRSRAAVLLSIGACIAIGWSIWMSITT
jgi:hypothetical protein